MTEIPLGTISAVTTVGFRECWPWQPTAWQTCSRKAPRSKHRPSL